MLLLGIDLGSSSIKLTVFNGNNDQVVAETTQPQNEMPISAPSPGFAEQDPDMWWHHFCEGLVELRRKGVNTLDISAIGIAYQMHGLVCLDEQLSPLRPSIIWCDSRAVNIGKQAGELLGADYCHRQLLNTPGNFTASKLRWVQENEPEVFAKIAHIMLPGDYLATRLCLAPSTTAAGLSEGILWDYENQTIAKELLAHWGINEDIIAPIVEQFGIQGRVANEVAEQLGLNPNAAVTYRAGDQPNNALSLNAFKHGEIAATAGTSAVIYGCSNTPVADQQERVNTFLHTAADASSSTYGALMCINGGARAFAWLNQLLGQYSYPQLNELANTAPLGSEGLLFIPFGNGAERILANRNINASWVNLDFNRHDLKHMVRSVQEGIACAMRYGFDLLKAMGVEGECIRAGNNNLFLSELFAQTVANLTGLPIELYETSGSEGAARAAGIGIGHYKNSEDAFANLQVIRRYQPNHAVSQAIETHYQAWLTALNSHLH